MSSKPTRIPGYDALANKYEGRWWLDFGGELLTIDIFRRDDNRWRCIASNPEGQTNDPECESHSSSDLAKQIEHTFGSKLYR